MGVGRTKLDPAWRKTMIAGLLRGQRPDGSFGVHPYDKWTGAHWRLISLVELGIPRTNRAARAAANSVLDWIANPRRAPFVVKGLEAVDHALQIRPDYMEALVYKNLLLRSQALLEKDSAKQAALIKEADRLRDKAQELRKQKAAGVS